VDSHTQDIRPSTQGKLAKLVRQMEQSLTDKVKEIEFLKRTVTDLEYSLADAQADLAHEKSIVED